MPLSSTNASAPSDPIYRDEKNDIVLRSSDNISFRYRKIHLQSMSPVFDTMLTDGRGEGARKKTGDGLDIVNLAEDSSELAAFLRFMHPQSVNPSLAEFADLERCVRAPFLRTGPLLGRPPSALLAHPDSAWPLPNCRLCELSDKYQTKSVLHAVLAQAERLLPSDAPDILALALVHFPERIGSAALRAFDGPFAKSNSCGEWIVTPPRYTINSMSVDMFDRLPATTQRQLARLQVSILSPVKGGLTGWGPVADKLQEVRPTVGDRLPRVRVD